MGDRMCKRGRDRDSSSLGTWQPWGPCDTGLEAETPWERQILGVPEAAGQGQRGRRSSSGPGQGSPHVQRWRQASRHQVGVGTDRVREQNPPELGRAPPEVSVCRRQGREPLGFCGPHSGEAGDAQATMAPPGAVAQVGEQRECPGPRGAVWVGRWKPESGCEVLEVQAGQGAHLSSGAGSGPGRFRRCWSRLRPAGCCWPRPCWCPAPGASRSPRPAARTAQPHTPPGRASRTGGHCRPHLQSQGRDGTPWFMTPVALTLTPDPNDP